MCLFAMLRANLHEGMQGARSDVKSQAFMEEQSDFTICPPLATQFTDQFGGAPTWSGAILEEEIRGCADASVPSIMAPEHRGLLFQ